jgi:hypothetical protein
LTFSSANLSHHWGAKLKLKWSQIKRVTKAAFSFFKTGKHSDFEDGVRPLYNVYRTGSPPRTPKAESQGTFNTLKQKWNTDARSYCTSQRLVVRQSFNADTEQVKSQFLPPGTKVPPGSTDTFEYFPQHSAVRLKTRLQVEGEKGDIYDGQSLRQDAYIEAVAVDLNTTIARSRLNIVVRPECTGQPLFTKLSVFSVMLTHADSTSSGAICTWKVMNPTLGAEGPESAVIYLGVGLSDAKAKHAISVLSDLLHDDLQALTTLPFGLIRIRDGIYGCDLPDKETEISELKTPSKSSAGELISRIICKAAWEAAELLYHGKDAKRNQMQLLQAKMNEEQFLRDQLDLVFQGLGWELED